ncbi:IclR family transcriptional regulator [Gulosibacter sediminis]|uniref:IclR family transcriptional regulator n=1 Tax=Gulosibacter sediminis TaxID=1729695 RepID=UPI0024A805E5|nr:helix-turn-helix domain-containing protein [Gulosibacter sediminis]
MAPTTANRQTSSHAQTLSRGIRALEVLAEAGRPISIADLAAALDVHRSVAYRILRTLEDHGLVRRDSQGLIRLGPRMAQLARGVQRDLQTVALPELTDLANRFAVTAFVGLLDDDDIVTLMSVEPRVASTSVAQRPGSRHPVTAGAAGLAVRMQMSGPELDELRAHGLDPDDEGIRAAHLRGHATSSNEAVPGLSALAVPLPLADEQLASLAVVFLNSGEDRDEAAIVASLHEAARTISTALA